MNATSIVFVVNPDYPQKKASILDFVKKNNNLRSGTVTDGSSRGGMKIEDVTEVSPGSNLSLDNIRWLESWCCLMANRSVAKLFGIDNIKLVISGSWILLNRANSGDWNVPHLHMDSFISGVFYINIPNPETCGKFYAMDVNIVKFFLGESSSSVSDTYEIDPIEGRLMLFPGNMTHFVGPNLSDGDRVVYAFNTIPINPLTGDVLKVFGRDYEVGIGGEIPEHKRSW